jgi:hypothetical protein
MEKCVKRQKQFLSFFFFFGSTGVWTQDLTLARKTLLPFDW